MSRAKPTVFGVPMQLAPRGWSLEIAGFYVFMRSWGDAGWSWRAEGNQVQIDGEGRTAVKAAASVEGRLRELHALIAPFIGKINHA